MTLSVFGLLIVAAQEIGDGDQMKDERFCSDISQALGMVR
jgi:hypothetical protein